MADLFLLVMLRVIAVFATQNHRARKASVAKFAVRTFSARHERKARGLKVGDELMSWRILRGIISGYQRRAWSASDRLAR